MEILRVQNLYKQYGTGETAVTALRDVSFSVQQGEYVAIVGPSGSGKSTLLHMIGGVDRPTSGNVWINGVDLYSQKEDQLAVFRRRNIGLVYQFYNLLPVLTAEENLTLPLLLDGRKVDKEQLQYIAGVLGIADRLHHLPNQLSGGQQQKVSIGRALLSHPVLMLADEPTGNLDSKSSAEVIGLLRYLHAQHGQTLIIITHDHTIAQGANRIISIEDGAIVRDEVVRA